MWILSPANPCPMLIPVQELVSEPDPWMQRRRRVGFKDYSRAGDIVCNCSVIAEIPPTYQFYSLELIYLESVSERLLLVVSLVCLHSSLIPRPSIVQGSIASSMQILILLPPSLHAESSTIGRPGNEVVCIRIHRLLI